MSSSAQPSSSFETSICWNLGKPSVMSICICQIYPESRKLIKSLAKPFLSDIAQTLFAINFFTEEGIDLTLSVDNFSYKSVRTQVSLMEFVTYTTKGSEITEDRCILQLVAPKEVLPNTRKNLMHCKISLKDIPCIGTVATANIYISYVLVVCKHNYYQRF